jgi:hypothetical protein
VLYDYPGDRVGYHLTSIDGIHNWTDQGLAYDPRYATQIFSYTDGTVDHWFKMERPSVLVENGLITHVTFAVADVNKDNQIPAGSNHGSKVIVVPFDGAAFDRDTGVGGAGGTGQGGAGGNAGIGGRGGGGQAGSGGGGQAGTGGTGGGAAGAPGGRGGSDGGTGGGAGGTDAGAVGSGGATGIAGTSGSGGTTAPGSGGTPGGNETGSAAGCSCALASSPFSNYAAGTLFIAVAVFGRARRRRRTGPGRILINTAPLGQGQHSR